MRRERAAPLRVERTITVRTRSSLTPFGWVAVGVAVATFAFTLVAFAVGAAALASWAGVG